MVLKALRWVATVHHSFTEPCKVTVSHRWHQDSRLRQGRFEDVAEESLSQAASRRKKRTMIIRWIGWIFGPRIVCAVQQVNAFVLARVSCGL